MSRTGLYFRYGDVKSRVTRWNLVTCNGVIHLVSHYLYEPPGATPRDPPVNTPTSLNDPVRDTGGAGRVGGRRWWRWGAVVLLALLVVTWTSSSLCDAWGAALFL